MKNFILSIFTITPLLSFSQDIDSIAIANQVDSLIKVSQTFTIQRNFDKALEINAIAEQLVLDELGTETAIYGRCCFNFGQIFKSKGDYSEAESKYIESKSIFEKTLGKDHRYYAATLYNMAELYNHLGNFEKAEPLFLESKIITKKTLGDGHLYYVMNLSSLANLYQNIGAYEKAEPHFIEAKDIMERTKGNEHANYAVSLNNLADLYERMGIYEKAEPLLLETKAIFAKSLGKEHRNYAACLNSLAGLYSSMGLYEKAELLFLEARAIFKKELDKEYYAYTANLLGLGNLYSDIGSYEKAESLFLEAQANWERIFGKEHPNVIACQSNLAILYGKMGGYKKTESLLLEVKRVFELELNETSHPFYINCLNNLAIAYDYLGAKEKAESFYLEAKAIIEKNQGKGHPDYAANLKGLTYFFEKHHMFLESEPLLEEIAYLNHNYLSKATTFLSERELGKYSATFQKDGDLLSSYLFSRRQKNTFEGDLSGLNYDHSLYYKGFLLNATNRIRTLTAFNPKGGELYKSLKEYRRRIAIQLTKPITERKGLVELEEKANALEKEMARTITGFGEAMQLVFWQQVQTQLSSEEAAIEFIHFRFDSENPMESVLYAALIIRPDDAAPLFITLFEEREIMPLLKGATGKAYNRINELYAGQMDNALRRNLYDLIWKPMEKNLEGVSNIYCSPSGLLHRINLAATVAPPLGSKGEAPQIVVLGSTRSLVLPDVTHREGKEALLIGGVRYATDSTAVAEVNKDIKEEDWINQNNLPFQSNGSRGGNWDYLPHSLTEVQNIQAHLQSADWTVKLDTGYYATEEAFRYIGRGKPSPRILHIATHGFFFPDPEDTARKRSSLFRQDDVVFRISDHPMIGSGLLLAGSEEAWSGGKAPEGQEDGVLTAYEISQMNLSNTELVVLSACETGLGDIENNEGVYGLQRAFKIAGTKYLIMTLWKVSDMSSRIFMTEFYRQWLE